MSSNKMMNKNTKSTFAIINIRGKKNELKNNTANEPQTIKNRCVKNKSLIKFVGFNF